MDMERAASAVAAWANEGETAAPPAWEELPAIPLYMDQVILYLGESLKLFQREEASLLFGDYPRRTQEAFDFYRRYMAAAAYLGGKYVVIHGQPQGHGKLTDEGYWERFGRLYRLGEEEGAYPAQENVRQHRAGTVEFVAGMARYLGDSCGFVLDVKQCRMAGASIQEMARAMGKRLVHVHLSDEGEGSPCLLPGAGQFDHQAFRRLLEGQGFAGTVVTEVYRTSFSQFQELEDSLYFTKKIFKSSFS